MRERNEQYDSLMFKIALLCERLEQRELADALGIHRSTISRWATGQLIPSALDRARIAQHIDWHEQDLFPDQVPGKETQEKQKSDSKTGMVRR